MKGLKTFCAIAILALFLCCSDRSSTSKDTEPPTPEDENPPTRQQMNLYAEPDIFGWILLERNMNKVLEYIDAAPNFGVNAIQLSHSIIMDIDDILEEPDTSAFINDATDAAHENGLKVYIWTHELNTELPLVCFDPADPFWEERRNVYRQALSMVPQVDGVVVSFGSASPEPWWAPCFCEYCRNLPPTGNPILDAINSHPVERIHLLFDVLHRVVVDEFKKELLIRTFIHLPAELEWMLEALHTSPTRELSVMSKCVPQDWEPFYPHNPVICDNGGFDQVVEFDLGAEYWGESVFPFAMPEYLKYRLEYELRCGIRGAFARIERGSHAAFDTPNEVNMYAFSELLGDVTRSTDEIWKEWVQQRYGVEPESTEGEALINALRRTFDIVRKMYYVKGFWLEKGSDVPTDMAGINEMLVMRSLANWDDDYQAWDAELKAPTKKTLSDIAQEKHEAHALAEESLADLEAAKAALSDEDYQDLRHRLEHLRDCTLVWNQLYQAVFRWKHIQQTGDEQEKLYLEWNLEELSALADYMESKYGSGISPGNPNRIRELASDIRDRFGEHGDGVPFEQMTIDDIKVCETGADYAVICWQTSKESSSLVEYGAEIPDYGEIAGNPDELVTSHSVRLEGLKQKTRYVFRVHSQNAQGSLITSGDYSFTTE